MKKYFGSREIMISTANIEIIQQHKPKVDTDNDNNIIEAIKLELYTDEDCHLIIDDGEPIFHKCTLPFTIDEHLEDLPITKLVIVDPNIHYHYMGIWSLDN